MGSLGHNHPRLVEVYYDTTGAENEEQWVKLFNPCTVDIDLGDYSLGWGGVDYTVGTADLEGTIGVDECFIVGGPRIDAPGALHHISNSLVPPLPMEQ